MHNIVLDKKMLSKIAMQVQSAIFFLAPIVISFGRKETDVLLTAVSAVSLTAVDAIDAVGHPPAGRCPEPVRVQAFAWHRRLSRARVIAR